MKLPAASIRTHLFLTVIIMGILSVTLALATGRLIYDFTHSNQKLIIEKLVTKQTDELFKILADETKDLAYSLQSESQFSLIVKEGKHDKIQDLLDNQYQRQYIDDGIIKVTSLAIYDKKFQTLATSSNKLNSHNEQIACKQFASEIQSSKSTARYKANYKLCNHNDKPYFSLITPIGGLKPYAYLHIETDPIPALEPLASIIGMPTLIKNALNQKIYASPAWPTIINDDILVGVPYYVKDSDQSIIFSITAAENIHALNSRLRSVIMLIIFSAIVITTIAVLFNTWRLQVSIITPIVHLCKQLRLVRQDNQQLGNQVTVEGNSEVKQLANEFNEMTIELKKLYQSMESMALTDPLTTLPNRLQLQTRLNHLINLYKRENLEFSLFLIDLDRFKQVNDTLGHLTGDQLLQEIGHRLRSALRCTDYITHLNSSEQELSSEDMVARLGGDEFAVLLPQVNSVSSATNVAKNLLDSIKESIIIKDHTINPSLSIGIALYPKDGDEAGELFSHADVAMYKAKRSGSGYAFYDPSLEHSLYEKLTLENELTNALNHDQFILYYQPQINIITRQVEGAEALIRWQHPEKGLIPPDRFIPIAEETGLINKLSLWVIRQAITDMAKWHQQGHTINISINISTRDLHNIELVNVLTDALETQSAAAQHVTLELTEGSIMSDPEQIKPILLKFDEMGVKFSIDDFGTGYSALNQLRILPVDEIKIDRSFVKDMLSNDNDAILVKTIAKVGASLELNVVAEGVETLEHLEALKSFGANLAQGYAISRPLPMEEFCAWLETPVWAIEENG